MKRLLSILTVLAVLFTSTLSFAACPLNGFKKGLKDVVTSPAEVSDNLMAETKGAKFFPFAFAGGLLKGGFYMGKKIVTGVLEMVTSPLEVMKK